MICEYTVADNAMTIEGVEGMRAWRELEPRFRPFASAGAAAPVVAIDVREVDVLPDADVRWTYEPEYDGVGFITARAATLPDGDVLMEFSHVEESKPRLRMRINDAHDRAEVVMRHGGDGCDKYFLTHAIMLAYVMATSGNGTLMIHASVVMHGGRGYLFCGRSGTGKSTHASLWLRHVEGTELLNDDHPVLRITPDGVPTVYGSPWSGKTDCYRNLSVPVGAIVRIVRGADNRLVPLKGLQAYASLTASVFFLPLMSAEARETRHRMVERLAGEVRVAEMHCRPDADAALTCLRALEGRAETGEGRQ